MSGENNNMNEENTVKMMQILYTMECKRVVHFFETWTVSNVKGNTHELK